MLGETGIGIQNPLWFVGVVENRIDPRKEGRVQVRAFGVHGTNTQIATQDLPWAICISGNYDPNYPIPPLNSWVFGFFLDGRDAQQPMILGLIPTQMTELIDPEKNGWGVIPTENVREHSQGSRAIDFGQPANSRKARGEDLDKTDILLQEVSRVSADFSSLQEQFVVEEPAPGAEPVYPFNRVTETAGGHCFELDDSPGAARVRLGHAEGQFLEMHQNGVTVLKSANDLFLLSPSNITIIAKAGQVVKVEGNAVFSVEGNMVHEVHGNMQQIVRGNYELSVAGQLNINGGEEIQARAAKVRLESNVEGINLKSAKKINIQSGEVINIKSGQGIFQEAVDDINIKGDNLFMQGAGSFNFKAGDKISHEAAGNINIKGDSLFIQGSGDANIKSARLYLDSAGDLSLKAAYTKIGNGQVSIKGTTVAIDDIIYLSSGQSVTAPGGSDATAAEDAIAASPAESTELPEPAIKSAGNGSGGGGGGILGGGGYKSPSIAGSGGYVSQDDGGRDDGSSGETTSTSSSGLTPSYTQDALTPLLDFIGKAEGAGYDTFSTYITNRADYPPKPLTSLTIDEVLAWQNSIDYFSKAAGKYQIVTDTLRGLKTNKAASGDEVFNPATQDKLAVALLKRRGLNRFLNGTMDIYEFGNNLAAEWASLPVMKVGTPTTSTKGRYPGQGGKISVQEVLDVLKKVKDYKSSDSNIGNTIVGPQ